MVAKKSTASKRKAGTKSAGKAKTTKKAAKKSAKKPTMKTSKKAAGSTSKKKSKKTKDQLGLFGNGKATAKRTRAVQPEAEPKKKIVHRERVERKKARKRLRRGASVAERMAAQQREISVSEFFTKNRHLLGFDNLAKALLTTVKEAVDNSLDACEEAKILPELSVELKQMGENRYKVKVTDNGPGILPAQIPKIFGKLLYGSKFHRLKQSRGQQGIGISAAGMYGQLTTGKPVICISRTADKLAHRFEIKIDTRQNKPEWTDEEVEWDQEHGTCVELEIEATYRGGKRSVDQYIEQTAIANPHLTIHYVNPKGDRFDHERLKPELPREPAEIKPHPHGVELGVLMNMLKDTRGRDLKGALQRDFSRVSEKVALAICEEAGLSHKARPRRIDIEQAEKLHRAMGVVKVMNPPTSCVVPIGEDLIRLGMEHGVEADFFTSVTRSPSVYRGNPFLIEAGLAWGGNLPKDELCTLYRFANRVPLQYQQSDCVVSRAVIETDWRHYKVSQGRGALPSGPLVIMVHMASVWVPFTSESKEAVARYPEILKEIKLALQICGRRLAHHLSARRREAEEGRKHDYIATYIPHIGEALREILGTSEKREQLVVDTLTDTLQRSRKFI
ncbi:MAG: DNA topoisomerase VI subunit B [Deltaproteobacteria bacterium]|nr:DNA topoisomerase VI subunit B [Deltaproteobacteria bacterium]